jgi:hypothetical protein
MLYDLSPNSLARIDQALRRERVGRLSGLSKDDQDDCLQEICLSLLQDPENTDRSIRRGIRRWKSTLDVVKVPQMFGCRFQVTLFSEIDDENSADAWD